MCRSWRICRPHCHSSGIPSHHGAGCYESVGPPLPSYPRHQPPHPCGWTEAYLHTDRQAHTYMHTQIDRQTALQQRISIYTLQNTILSHLLNSAAWIYHNLPKVLSKASLFPLNSPFNRAECIVNRCTFSPKTERSELFIYFCFLCLCVYVQKSGWDVSDNCNGGLNSEAESDLVNPILPPFLSEWVCSMWNLLGDTT